MGGRGSKFQSAAPIPTQISSPSGLTQADLQNMSDQELHDFLINVDKTDIPDFLSDLHLQRMIYTLGMNDTPEIVSQAEFDDMVNNVPFGSTPTVIYRTVNDTQVNGVDFTSQDICDMMIGGDVTYVGHGIHGDGLYFSNDMQGSKAYGVQSLHPKTMAAVLNNNAKIITERKLKSEYDAFVKTHPSTRRALGFAKTKSSHDSMSQFALIRGYNVIVSPQGGGENYYTVLDRKVLTMTRQTQ